MGEGHHLLKGKVVNVTWLMRRVGVGAVQFAAASVGHTHGFMRRQHPGGVFIFSFRLQALKQNSEMTEALFESF